MTQRIDDSIPEWIRKYPRPVSSLPLGNSERTQTSCAQSLVLHLASNENPLGPSPRAIEAARRVLDNAHRYAPGSDVRLRKALAACHGVASENVILGAGSSELIELAARLVLTPGDTGITSASTFPLYATAIRLAGAELIEPPLRGRTIDLEAIARTLSASGQARAKIIYLANPNNPTGTMFTAGDFDDFLKRVPPNVLVVLDEAYAEYVEREDYSRSMDVIAHRENVLVLRTFSKVYGLAGLRIGYGVGSPALLEQLDKVRIPFNTSVVSEEAALAALEDKEHVSRSVGSNRAGMAQLREGLAMMGLKLAVAFGNFVMVELGVDAQKIANLMVDEGVVARPLGVLGFPQAIRATVSTREGNEKFIVALGNAVSRG